MLVLRAAGFDLLLRRDRRHRAERLRDRGPRGRLGLRDDARVRRAVAAREDRHARARRRWWCSTSPTGAAPRTRCATCGASGGAIIPGASADDAELPVFATVASQWDDPGLDRLYAALQRTRRGARAPRARTRRSARAERDRLRRRRSSRRARALPRPRSPRRCGRYRAAAASRRGRARPRGAGARAARARPRGRPRGRARGSRRAPRGARWPGSSRRCGPRSKRWPETRERYAAERQSYGVRGQRDRGGESRRDALRDEAAARLAAASGRGLGRARALPLARRTCPVDFPFTAGVFPFKRSEEDPARMFAGEGPPERTNRRFHLLAAGQPATRLSTAFDSVTLYGRDPARAARHLGQGRNLGRLGLHARRREEALLGLRPVRPAHLRVDDDQRAGADGARVLPERGDRPAGRATPARSGASSRPCARRFASRRPLPAYAGAAVRSGARRARPRPARHPRRRGRGRRDLRADPRRRARSASAARCRPTS